MGTLPPSCDAGLPGNKQDQQQAVSHDILHPSTHTPTPPDPPTRPPTHLTRMSACSGASHSRMSAGTMVTVPSQPSATSRFCSVTTALGFFSTAYTLQAGRGGGHRGAGNRPQQVGNAGCRSWAGSASLILKQRCPSQPHAQPSQLTAGGAWRGRRRAEMRPPGVHGRRPPPSEQSPGCPPPPEHSKWEELRMLRGALGRQRAARCRLQPAAVKVHEPTF